MRTSRNPKPLAQGLAEIPGILGTDRGSIYGDPADRLIVATALAGHQLVTSDTRILTWPGVLDRRDAKA